MHFWGPLELARLALVRSDVQERITRVRDRFENATGIAVYVISGWRSQQEQAATYADSLKEGFRAAPANTSRHPLGAAVDIGISGHVSSAEHDQKDPLYKQLADIAVQEGLKAGYYFHGGDPDPYHFEADEPLSTSQAIWAKLVKERLRRVAPVGAIVLVVAIVALVLYARKRHH